nr:MAG TPA: antirepressor [Caudoviricetes sp.]
MQQLLHFDKMPLTVIKNSQGIYFELYSTGAALGYTTIAKGKVYPHKLRIDKIVENAEITPVVHGVQPFLTESQLYDFMLESRSEVCRKFRKWVTQEVLPSINHTGSYSLEQKQEQPYEYFDKTFNGVPVLSILDIVHFTGLSQTTINGYLRKSDLICGIDYFVAEGRALAEMKKRHPKMSAMIPRMLLITKSGFDKLMKENGIRIASVPCFNTPTHKERPKKLYAMVPQNENIQKKLQHIHAKMQALEELMVCYNRYNVEVETSKVFLSAIKSVGVDIMTSVFDLEDIKPKTTTEKVL